MKIDRNNFQEMFNENDIPSWPCPHCDKGTLSISENGFKVAETTKTLKHRTDDEHQPDWDTGIFMGKMTCSYHKCKEIIIFTGEACLDFNEYIEVPDTDRSEYTATYAWFITPKHFSKAIKLFQFHENYPKKTIPLIERAFSLLWVDTASSANMIRSTVEIILDDMKVQKYEDVFIKKIGKKVRKPIPLQRRIQDFTDTDLARKNPKYADTIDFFHAIRWIGNVGSHGNDDKLKRGDLIDAFEFLESALGNIYNPHHKSLKSSAKKIIKRKGLIKRMTK